MKKYYKKPLVSFIIITRNRKEDLRECLKSIIIQDYKNKEIIVVDNNSQNGTHLLFEKEFSLSNISYIRLTENKGVCGGRNEAIKAAKGEILITLDDDAVIDDPNAAIKIVNKFKKDPSIGVLAFKVLNYFTGKVDKDFFPTRDKKRTPNEEFEVSTFIGVAHAIPRYIYEQVGVYHDYFPYGHEELDLALRILDAGYKIIYFPEITIRHKIKGSRRQRLSGKWDIILENRIKVAIRNLPWRYVASTACIWSLRTLFDCRGDFRPILNAWRSLWRKRHQLKCERHVINKETIRRIRELKGPLLY